MQYRQLGRSGLFLTDLSLGTMTFGDPAAKGRPPKRRRRSSTAFSMPGATTWIPPMFTTPESRKDCRPGPGNAPPSPASSSATRLRLDTPCLLHTLGLDSARLSPFCCPAFGRAHAEALRRVASFKKRLLVFSERRTANSELQTANCKPSPTPPPATPAAAPSSAAPPAHTAIARFF